MPTTLPRALAFLLGFALALWLLQPLARGESSTGAEAASPELLRLEDELHRAVNRVRREAGRIPLARDPALDRVAREHSLDMARRGYLAHETPEGLDPVARLERAGIAGFTLAGENVGLTNRAAPNREILEGWLRSPVHRRNLLAPAFNATGIGIARAADGTLYYTQLYLTFPR